MSSSNRFGWKLRQRWLKLRLKPVRVFCFHQVSDVFEPDSMWECDWTQTEVFKNRVLALKEKYTFISLEEAYCHISNDKFRVKNYASLTADDGWASLKNILPWLAEQKIPVTLFLNPLYLDGKHFQERATEKLLTREDVFSLVSEYKPFLTIASHGWSHKDCTEMSDGEFESNVSMAETALQGMEGKIPFYAFTFGRYKSSQVGLLKSQSLVPVCMDGTMNYSDASSVHRELLDEKRD